MGSAWRWMILVTVVLALAFSVSIVRREAMGDGATGKPEENIFPDSSPSTEWENAGFIDSVRMLDIPVDTDIQWKIFTECDFDTFRYCFLMAIAKRETAFDPASIGDGGNSVGMFQVNTVWHGDRMKRLGVGDLTDPVQCAAVALDYIEELIDKYGFAPDSVELAMAYNMGPTGAAKAIESGISETEYSKDVMAAYKEFMSEIG